MFVYQNSDYPPGRDGRHGGRGGVRIGVLDQGRGDRGLAGHPAPGVAPRPGAALRARGGPATLQGAARDHSAPYDRGMLRGVLF